MTRMTYFFCLLITASCFASEPNFLSHKVRETIEEAHEIPGLDADIFDELKPEILTSLQELELNGELRIASSDQKARPIFVSLQGIFEQMLSTELNGQVSSLMGIIHTPMPCTPLCTEGPVSDGLVDPSIKNDPRRLFTVEARTKILRDYLKKGGDLYIVYPKDGLAKRSQEQQQIYQKELQTYPNNLFDCPLNCESLEADLIGAIYFFTDSQENEYVFAIQMTQANDPRDNGQYCLWLGRIDHPAISERVSKVLTFICKH